MTNQSAALKTAAEVGTERTRSGVFYRPNVDIVEKPEELVLLADVPGAKGDQVDIHFEDGTLSLHAKVEPRRENGDYLLQEYGVGDYWRTFEISEAIDASKISAEYADGVLTLHLPKADAVKPRRIEIKPK
jgi:HSP20 family molecular chaperone IbpA